MSEPIADVPSPIDLRRTADAEEWARSATEKRPWRAAFFARIASEISTVSNAEVLELGSGPGFLAEKVLADCRCAHYTMLDFSEAMHALARPRLGSHAARATFVVADFKRSNWRDGLGTFDFVATVQAVHELRHKARAATLHAKVRKLLKPSGIYLVCDHYVGPGGMSDAQLYMTVGEQRAALEAAGFRVTELMRERGLVLHQAVQE